MQATIQFHVTDESPGHYYLLISRGTCTAYEGLASRPALIIRTSTEVWRAIGRGELDGKAAWLAGKYTVKGRLGLLVRFGRLSPRVGTAGADPQL